MRCSLILAGWMVLPIALLASTNTQSVYSYKPMLNQDFVTPRTLVDPRTKISYFLDSDGRHISAIAPNGKLIWRLDPFEEARLSPYRFSRPIIIYFEFPSEEWWRHKTQYGKRTEFICVNYNSSQFGLLRKSSGQFIFEGQD
jgi:hypothetical protein